MRDLYAEAVARGIQQLRWIGEVKSGGCCYRLVCYVTVRALGIAGPTSDIRPGKGRVLRGANSAAYQLGWRAHMHPLRL